MKTDSNQSYSNSESWEDLLKTVVIDSLPKTLLTTGLLVASTIGSPVGATVAAGGLAAYGAIKVIKWLNN